MTIDAQLYGVDLFGQPMRPPQDSPVAQKFLIPPFTVLNAREGDWQERKRAWMAMGIKGELGRDAPAYSCNGETGKKYEYMPEFDTGTSIFDPVICELAYRWFTAEGWQVVDPFAGGSVRGIVASCLGRKYWGGELRGEQVEANRAQADGIIGKTVPVKISSAMLRQSFHSCTSDFVQNVCRGRCCESATGIKVSVHPTEEAKFKDMGATIKDSFMVADERGLCPFKTDEGMCGTHQDKPMGCRFSPFTLNENGTLIVRNRYRLLKCYSCEGAEPAYKAHAWSLAQVFGDEEARRITKHLDDGGGDIVADMPAHHHSIMRENDAAKGSKVQQSTRPVWVCGDSAITLDDAPTADFVFSCPPYGNLEVYSDDPQDLSAMDHAAFLVAYRAIIAKSCAKLKPNRFACFVVGDFRDKKGNYRNFVSDTIGAFLDAGMELYNEAILVTSVGSACMRVTKQFESGRKFAKTHQNVLVFIKGCGKKATQEMKP